MGGITMPGMAMPGGAMVGGVPTLTAEQVVLSCFCGKYKFSCRRLIAYGLNPALEVGHNNWSIIYVFQTVCELSTLFSV
jgi:hypothetical protein